LSDAAIANLVTGLVTIGGMVVGFLTLWVKLKYGVEQAEEAARKTQAVEHKIDTNTRLTQSGADQATKTAAIAAETAAQTKDAVEDMAASISKKLNGGLDAAISQAVDPVKAVLNDHGQTVQALEAKFDDLTRYVHQRNHDILNAMQTLTNQIAALRCQGDRDKKT